MACCLYRVPQLQDHQRCGQLAAFELHAENRLESAGMQLRYRANADQVMLIYGMELGAFFQSLCCRNWSFQDRGSRLVTCSRHTAADHIEQIRVVKHGQQIDSAQYDWVGIITDLRIPWYYMRTLSPSRRGILACSRDEP